jgi:hypothetical protein
MDGATASSNRRSDRSNVFLKATLETSGASQSVVLRNLSQQGALVQGKELPSAASRVLFHRQGLSVPGRVAWCHCGYAGIEFDFPLFLKEMLRHVPAPPEKPAVPAKRRPGLSSKPLTTAERSLIERWAIECARAEDV